MTLAVDIGNSNIVIAMYRDGSWTQQFRAVTHAEQPSAFYLHGLQDILLEWGIHPTSIDYIGLSSVVPSLTDELVHIIYQVTGSVPTVLNTDFYTKVPFTVPQPYEIGSDLVANAIACHHLYQRDCLIVDFGTALTFTVYEHGVGIIGVTIAPGIRTAMKSLAGNTAQLPEADISIPDSVIGRDTSHAIQAGVLHGYTGLVRHMVTAIKKEVPHPLSVVATGGMASQLDLTDTIDVINKQLTLEGIRLAIDL